MPTRVLGAFYKRDLTGTTRPSAAAVAVENVFGGLSLNPPALFFENWRPKNDKQY
jgi:hypothetical protein